MPKKHELDGKRIKLLHIDDKFTDLKSGDLGTVDYVDDIGNIHMKWDNGGTLALIPDLDTYEIITESVKTTKKIKSDRRIMLFESFNLQNAMDTLEFGIADIKKIVSKSGLIQMDYESYPEDFSGQLSIFFEDGNNTQGNVYMIELDNNSVTKMPFVRSKNIGDNEPESLEPVESHYISVDGIVSFLIKEVNDFIRIEESKKYKMDKNTKKV